jgi:hypothetical protein
MGSSLICIRDDYRRSETQSELHSDPVALTLNLNQISINRSDRTIHCGVVELAGREVEFTNAPPVVKLRQRTSNPVSSLELSVHVTSSIRAPAAAAATLTERLVQHTLYRKGLLL